MNLKQLRRKANLTQGEISKLLGFSTPQFISNMERHPDTVMIPDECIAPMALHYGISPDILIRLKLKALKTRMERVVYGTK